MTTIPVGKNKFSIVDPEDFEYLNQWRWHLHLGYARRFFWTGLRQKGMLMHRVIMSPLDGLQVDHINGDRLDNRRSNLRICTNLQNSQNSKLGKRNTSGFKGVTYSKPNRKWKANLTLNQKLLCLGYFTTPVEAALAYNEAAIKHFGAFARLNELPE